MDLSTALSEIIDLSIEERIRVVQAILDSIAMDQAPPELTEGQKAELDLRLAAYEANPQDVLTWEEIKAHVRARR